MYGLRDVKEAYVAGVGYPLLIGLRGPSGSGKTTFAVRLIEALREAGVRVGWVKRTHHEVDAPHKASGRVWAAGAEATVLAARDRDQLAFRPRGSSGLGLADYVADRCDVVLIETHNPLSGVPTFRARTAEDVAGEEELGSWSLDSLEADAARAVEVVRAMLPPDLPFERLLRLARRAHGSRGGCPGLVLGTRMVLAAGRLFGIEVPHDGSRWAVVVETTRCAADAVQALTGTRLGKGTLVVQDEGKLAATFVDRERWRAVRIAARSGLREAAAEAFPGMEPWEAQKLAYRRFADDELFRWRDVPIPADARERSRGHVRCFSCDEEVEHARHVPSAFGPLCRRCADGWEIPLEEELAWPCLDATS